MDSQPPKSRASNDRKPSTDRLVTRAGLVIAAPSTMLACLQLTERPELTELSSLANILPAEATISAIIVGGAILVRRPISQIITRASAELTRRYDRKIGCSWVHLDQQNAQDSFPYYAPVMKREIRVKSLTPAMFQCLLESEGKQIPRAASRFLLQNLHAIPRPDLLDHVEHALMLPKGSFQKGFRLPGISGMSLTRDLAISRLRWLSEANIAHAFTFAPVTARTSRQKIVQLHDAVERQILEDNDHDDMEVV